MYLIHKTRLSGSLHIRHVIGSGRSRSMLVDSVVHTRHWTILHIHWKTISSTPPLYILRSNNEARSIRLSPFDLLTSSIGPWSHEKFPTILNISSVAEQSVYCDRDTDKLQFKPRILVECTQAPTLLQNDSIIRHYLPREIVPALIVQSVPDLIELKHRNTNVF